MEAGEKDAPAQLATLVGQRQSDARAAPQLDRTMVMDTRKVREMLAKAASTSGNATVQTLDIGQIPSTLNVRVAGNRKVGTLTVIAGGTDRQHYVLSSKLTVIGRSQMASIRLRRWFAPRVAASILQREDGYFLVAAAKNIKFRVNNTDAMYGQKELRAGDVIEVAGITATFDYET